MEESGVSSQLSSSPTRFPDCCLAISSTLISSLITLLPKKPAFTLSIGSGSGLLESLLNESNGKVSVQGVEVGSNVNRHLAEEDMHVVAGTWGLYSLAQEAIAWMFIYPREPKLITKYIDTYGDGNVELIIWLGPRVDWPEYELCFRQSSFSVLSFPEIGLAQYEIAVVARKS
ncbi:hypothetical protein ASPZODRAFT_78019 [Penicilliopsis zonata CBS 506.65]|uniref:Uncharacterized protein n=1 Tax=Penicilliopsis zonata CBS 506.65 TaxID=1073090 RepID=A0A1L9S4D4_9EURO|nr:hypothetical protein ASPZODRAFT_78019 [Penicilliopsis zonata CBS 506.65]OJJ42016.1 hypothetical protein ASPZODRAFT_78019 [Penicilliopsis zonata CBS 506.65]